MAKFFAIARGARTERAWELPPPLSSEEGVPCILRPLNGLEEEEVLTAARQRAKAQGVEEPRPGEPIYDLALMVETIAVAVRDPDSPRGDRQPMFDGPDEVRREYGREAIAYVYEVHQTLQDEASPQLSKLDPKGYVEAIATLGGPDEEQARRFLARLRPGLVWSLVRTLAAQQWSSLWGSSPSGGSSEPTTPRSKNEAAS